MKDFFYGTCIILCIAGMIWHPVAIAMLTINIIGYTVQWSQSGTNS